MRDVADDIDGLFIAPYNNAGALTAVSDAINRYTGYRTEVILNEKTNYLKYPGGMCLQDKETKDFLDSSIGNVKTLVFTLYNPAYYQGSFNFWNHTDGKRMILTHHGTKLRQRPIGTRGMYDSIIVSTPELTRYNDFIKFIPRPLNVPEVSGISKRPNFTIGHDVTSFESISEYRKTLAYPDMYPDYIPDWETLKTSLILFQQCRINGVRFENHGGCTWEESVKHKAEMWAYFDQLFVGDYGLAAQEAMYYGVPVIAYLCPESVRINKDMFGEFPGINTTYREFPECFKRHLKADDWASIGKDCASWVRRAYDPAKCARLWAEEMFE